ncbi:hypothetical protein Fuma_03676 [Fuerstiella marisgermanici]|uniref:Uncharacterized protein n=1 Tax=Fuerstiella marisgermanici TaxID=1891926 RepID=A0A1P8WJ17_9PLAN|nr:hypothetical protein Fuma_03676 [Fuerstiella marisgermanici]
MDHLQKDQKAHFGHVKATSRDQEIRIFGFKWGGLPPECYPVSPLYCCVIFVVITDFIWLNSDPGRFSGNTYAWGIENHSRRRLFSSF